MLVTIKQIDQNVVKVSEVTAVIERIAFQTNLLALIAAVEAARTSQQRRSFAVVANEVGNLAKRSTIATREIKELIESSTTTAQRGLAQAVTVGQAMVHLKQTIRQASDDFAMVESASIEQRQNIEPVNVAVGAMDSVTQQNAALVGQVAPATRSLEAHTLELKIEIAAFKV